MRYFIYKCKLMEDALLLPDFINKLKLKHSVEAQEERNGTYASLMILIVKYGRY